MATRNTRSARQARPVVAPATPQGLDDLVKNFEEKEVSSKYTTVSGRQKVSPAFRSTIAEAMILRKEGADRSFCLLTFKSGGSKTASLVYSQASDDQLINKKLDVKSLEYVSTFKDGKHYLNITGKVL
jgi:hypothetical protein